MKGKDFINSKWCERAKTADGQSEIKMKFGKWASSVNVPRLLSLAKQLYKFFVSPDIPTLSKVVVGGALLYIIAPIDLVPDLIPVIGWLDDIGVAGFALHYAVSQMDRLAELEAFEEIENTKGKSLDEILEGEISGTTEGNFDLPTVKDE